MIDWLSPERPRRCGDSPSATVITPLQWPLAGRAVARKSYPFVSLGCRICDLRNVDRWLERVVLGSIRVAPSFVKFQKQATWPWPSCGPPGQRHRLGVSERPTHFPGEMARGRLRRLALPPPLSNLPPQLLRVGRWPRCGSRERDRRGSNVGGPRGRRHGRVCSASPWQSPPVCRWQGGPT